MTKCGTHVARTGLVTLDYNYIHRAGSPEGHVEKALKLRGVLLTFIRLEHRKWRVCLKVAYPPISKHSRVYPSVSTSTCGLSRFLLFSSILYVDVVSGGKPG